MRIDERWTDAATLKDGTPVTLRLVRPDDAPLFERAFEQLSPASRYSRFFAAKQKLSRDELAYLTHPDNASHLAVGALMEGQGIGVARFVALGDGSAEAAVTVIDALQGKGLGTLLLARLAEAARERGIERFRAEVLSSNDAMLHLAATLGNTAIATRGDVVSFQIDLRQAERLSSRSP